MRVNVAIKTLTYHCQKTPLNFTLFPCTIDLRHCLGHRLAPAAGDHQKKLSAKGTSLKVVGGDLTDITGFVDVGRPLLLGYNVVRKSEERTHPRGRTRGVPEVDNKSHNDNGE